MKNSLDTISEVKEQPNRKKPNKLYEFVVLTTLIDLNNSFDFS